MPPVVPTASLGACFPSRSDKVCICFPLQVWHILLLRICSQLHQLLTSPARSQLCTWEKETIHPPFLGARSCPSSSSPQLQPLIPGLGDDQRRLQKVPDSLHFGHLSFQLLFSWLETPPVCVSPPARVIFTQRGPWHLRFSLNSCHVMGSPCPMAG